MMNFFRALTILVILLFTTDSQIQLFSQTSKERPNVIIIYTDDQGTLDAKCYGSKDLVTPAHDMLAKTGIRFTQMYSPSAICSASRAGMLTGRFPARAGCPAMYPPTLASLECQRGNHHR